MNKTPDYQEDIFIKAKFNWHEELLLYKIIEISNMTIAVTAVFHEENKFYEQVVLGKCLHSLQIKKNVLLWENWSFWRNWCK